MLKFYAFVCWLLVKRHRHICYFEHGLKLCYLNSLMLSFICCCRLCLRDLIETGVERLSWMSYERHYAVLGSIFLHKSCKYLCLHMTQQAEEGALNMITLLSMSHTPPSLCQYSRPVLRHHALSTQEHSRNTVLVFISCYGDLTTLWQEPSSYYGK